ncbi:MAG: hypothetical protein JWO86_3639 [Myxococcaceae bacterium]|nr:hypothetical protein [Myxococcaceae bacterium]MEA2748836.1 hypothetical protein [Myxococcales bacterium]
MSGGSSRDERFAQCGAGALEIGAVRLALEDDFDGESIHGVHKS